MKLLDKTRLKKLLQQLKQKDVFGYKKVVDENDILRQQLLMEIDYEKELAFNTNWVVGNNSPYVGSAIVGSTYVA